MVARGHVMLVHATSCEQPLPTLCVPYCTRSALKSSGWMRVCVRLLYRCASIRTEPHRAAPSPHTNGLRTIPCPISGRRVRVVARGHVMLVHATSCEQPLPTLCVLASLHHARQGSPTSLFPSYVAAIVEHDHFPGHGGRFGGGEGRETATFRCVRHQTFIPLVRGDRRAGGCVDLGREKQPGGLAPRVVWNTKFIQNVQRS